MIRKWIQRQNDVTRRDRGNPEVGWVQSDGGEVREAVRRENNKGETGRSIGFLPKFQTKHKFELL